MQLPVFYDDLKPHVRRAAREAYIQKQDGLCWYCHTPLADVPAKHVRSKRINWKLFPSGFRNWPVHLQHDHTTGLTEGAVHMMCNAVLWQYEGR